MASKIPIIYRGDDTDFNNDSHLSVTVNTDIPLPGLKAEVVFQGLRKLFSGVQNGIPIHFAYSARQTESFKVGVYKMQIRLRDDHNRVHTLPPKLCIVTDNATEADKWRQTVAQGDASVSVLTENDIFDCGVTMVDLKERIAYLWEKLGGSVDELSLKNMLDVKKTLMKLWRRYGGTVDNESKLNITP